MRPANLRKGGSIMADDDQDRRGGDTGFDEERDEDTGMGGM